MKKKVFISYSHEDSAKVKEFAVLLSLHGFDLWLDEKNISSGDSYTTKILTGIHDSDIYLLFLSQKSVNSVWVNAELDFALSERIKGRLTIIPVLLETTDIPIAISNIDYIDARFSMQEAVKQLSKNSQSKQIKLDSIVVSSVSFSLSDNTSLEIGPFSNEFTLADLENDRNRVLSDLRKKSYGILMNFVPLDSFDFQSDKPKFTNGLYEETVIKKEEGLRVGFVNVSPLKQLCIILP